MGGERPAFVMDQDAPPSPWRPLPANRLLRCILGARELGIGSSITVHTVPPSTARVPAFPPAWWFCRPWRAAP
jgi:hypothetical protein